MSPSETLVFFHQTARRCILEDRTNHLDGLFVSWLDTPPTSSLAGSCLVKQSKTQRAKVNSIANLREIERNVIILSLFVVATGSIIHTVLGSNSTRHVCVPISVYAVVPT